MLREEGGGESHFEEVWPKLRYEYLLEKVGSASHEEKLRWSNLHGMKLGDSKRNRRLAPRGTEYTNLR